MDKTSFLFSFAVLLVHCLVVASMARRVTNINTDQSALLALKAHITSETFNLLASNWSTTTPVCNWIGVTCGTRHQRVRVLDLSNMGLTGTIPPHMGNLSFLAWLDISKNNFHGDLPKEIGELHSLKILYMEHNQLTGPIPFTIFNISSLQRIALSYNGLSGILPADMCNRLPKLEWLLLPGNQLDGRIPSSLYECSQLQILSLSSNNFGGPIPSKLGNMTMLKKLAIGYNNLEGEIPLEVGNLGGLEFLSMENAGLTGLMPSFIFNISSLKILFLYGNNISGSLPRDMCLHLPILQKLYLFGNKLRGRIPGDIGNCSSLTEIDLSENNLTGLIPEEIGELLNLEVLFIDSNPLSGPFPATIFNISTLRNISFVGSHLSGNLPSCISSACLGLPNLEYLYLGQNNFSGTIPNIILNASKLASLDLSSNMLSGSIPNSIGGLRLLNFLNLRGNFFSSSSPELSFITSLTNCKHLTELEIHDNPLYGTLPVSIGNLSTSLEGFIAGNCGIIGNVPNEIGNLSNLAFLNLDNNYLIGFLPTTIKGLQKLQILSVAQNKLQGQIPDYLCHLQQLGNLDLGQNELFGKVPTCLGNITSLRYLALDFNNLTSPIPTSLWSLTDILSFNFSSNSFTGNLPPEIGNLKVATTMDLSRNQFSGQIPITIGGLQSLSYLSLAHNQLEGPIPEKCGNMLSLQFFDLSQNNLSGAIPLSLEALSYLKYLNVSFNRLSGEIPRGGPFANFTYQSFMANEALCGGVPQLQLPPCVASYINQSRRKIVLLILCIPLSMAFILLALTFAFVLRRRQKRSKLLSQSDLFSKITIERVTYQELVRATDDFNESNLLGTGSFGSVYKGVLTAGRILAVKVFHSLECGFKSFDTECEILRNIRHRNLTKVISSCSNLDFKALVLEYMPNGSLEKWLYSHNYFLDLLERLEIMIDVACALEYLHHGYSTPVIHRDLKPSNILLDEDMVAHVSDFGIAKFLVEGESIAQTKTLATFGYIAPEYGMKGLVSTKSDVYSYGILLMETFTRTKPTDAMFVDDLSLKRWVDESLSNALLYIIDANLLWPKDEHYTIKVRCVLSIMELAVNCSAESPEERMNMKDVLAELKKIKLTFLAGLEI